MHFFPHFLPFLRYGKLHRPCIALQAHISGHNFGMAGPNLLFHALRTYPCSFDWCITRYKIPKFTFVESFLQAAATFSKTRLFGISRLLSLCSYQYVPCILSYRKSPKQLPPSGNTTPLYARVLHVLLYMFYEFGDQYLSYDKAFVCLQLFTPYALLQTLQ